MGLFIKLTPASIVTATHKHAFTAARIGSMALWMPGRYETGTGHRSVTRTRKDLGQIWCMLMLRIVHMPTKISISAIEMLGLVVSDPSGYLSLLYVGILGRLSTFSYVNNSRYHNGQGKNYLQSKDSVLCPLEPCISML